MAIPLSPSKVREFVEAALLTKQIPYIYGPPGIGKSDLIADVAKEYNLKLIDIRLSQMLPEDLTGLPRFDEKTGKATYTPFDTFPMENDPLPKGMDGWLIFLDELSSSSEEVMAAIYSLLLGHRIGGKKLHKKAVIVGAGNRSSDSAIARPLPDTLITRLLPCEMKVSSKDWLKWSVTKCRTAHQSVVDFITKYPDMLINSSKPGERDELETYPTPRGWAKVFDVVNLNDKITADPAYVIQRSDTKITETCMALINSAVGTISATAFKDFYNEMSKIPHTFEVAASPMSTPIPATATARADLTKELSEYYLNNLTTDGDAILKYMNRMSAEEKAVFVVILSTNTTDNKRGNAIMTKAKDRLGIVINNHDQQPQLVPVPGVTPSGGLQAPANHKGKPQPLVVTNEALRMQGEALIMCEYDVQSRSRVYTSRSGIKYLEQTVVNSYPTLNQDDFDHAMGIKSSSEIDYDIPMTLSESHKPMPDDGDIFDD